MNLSGHRIRCKAGARARSPLGPMLALAAGVGGGLLIARRAAMVAEGKTLARPLPGAPNVGFRVPAKPLRFEHWGAREDLPPIDPHPNLAKISRTNSTKSEHKGHKIYTGSGHRCGVIPYSSVVWWIASWADDEQYKEEQPREGLFLAGAMNCWEEFSHPSLSL